MRPKGFCMNILFTIIAEAYIRQLNNARRICLKKISANFYWKAGLWQGIMPRIVWPFLAGVVKLSVQSKNQTMNTWLNLLTVWLVLRNRMQHGRWVTMSQHGKIFRIIWTDCAFYNQYRTCFLSTTLISVLKKNIAILRGCKEWRRVTPQWINTRDARLSWSSSDANRSSSLSMKPLLA